MSWRLRHISKLVAKHPKAGESTYYGIPLVEMNQQELMAVIAEISEQTCDEKAELIRQRDAALTRRKYDSETTEAY